MPLAEPPTAPRSGDSSWVLVVVGWLFGSLSLSALPPPSGVAVAVPEAGFDPEGGLSAPIPASGASVPAAVDLLRSPPRELRRLPGIGPLRAAAIAEERWRRAGRPFPLREVHGIGERTEARALGALGHEDARGWDGSGGRTRDGPR